MKYYFGKVIEKNWFRKLSGNNLNIPKYTLQLQPTASIRPLLSYKARWCKRVMHDLIDLIGRCLFEFDRYAVLEGHFCARGFEFLKVKQAASLGCHELFSQTHRHGL
jgi:hypothetical protein